MQFFKFAHRLESYLNNILPPETNHTDIASAMRYSCLDAGKRLRPSLVYSIGEMLGIKIESLDAPAASIELIHCYTLIHDDLPAMDDDDLRRGKPSCHKAFSESTAILAGDALQSLAFEILSEPSLNPIAPNKQILQINSLAKAIGAKGLILGQAEDIAFENKSIEIEKLQALHERKCGSLFTTCAELAINASEINIDAHIANNLKNYTQSLGLLFQVQDDILDVIGDPTKIGKTVGKDEKTKKSTYVSLLGLDKAKLEAHYLLDRALSALESFGDNATNLRQIANFAMERTN